ncbi:MAG TPA: polysaccharide deacetylase family protein [Acidimicrobiia bacterium]|nr:polysaccharide deacetylase family protein [Acidimicrobiia bacterium]
MPLDRSYLEYPHRTYGMDHDRYPWEMLQDRPPVTWPGGAHLAVWINVGLPYYPLDQSNSPFPPPHGMKTVYPDLRHYSLREYGHRVGVYRFFEALDAAGARVTFAVAARLAQRYPYLAERLAARDDEIACHGWTMNHPHHGDLDPGDESELVERSLSVLAEATGRAPVGWMSPGKSQSARTPDLLAANGVRYMADWVNDELPYRFRTDAGPIVSMPLSTELEDSTILVGALHGVSEYVDQVADAFDLLDAEARREGGRLLALSVHPWLLGQPHRIAAFEEILGMLTSRDGVWVAPAIEIVEAWEGQQA